jgi:hypothetical protein
LGRSAWSDRGTVDDCIAFLCATVHRGFLLSPTGTEEVFSWSCNVPRLMLSPVTCVMVEGDDGERSIAIPRQYLGSFGLGQIINLCKTKPHFGGVRYWFTCRCGRRVGRLYVSEGETTFLCRLCHGWTYRSCQEHNTRAEKEKELIEWFREDYLGI